MRPRWKTFAIISFAVVSLVGRARFKHKRMKLISMIGSTVESSTEVHVKNTEKHIKILHVDDDSNFLRIAKELLEMQGGLQVETAISVEEAKDKLRREKCDVIVSDYRMPGKDGLEFLKELREENNDIPFIIFIGKGREELAIKELLKLGADGYFEKHGEPEAVYRELAYGISEVVEKKRVKDDLRSSQAKYKSLLQNIPGMVYRARPDWSTEIIANSKSVCGYAIQEFDSRRVNWSDIIHPDDKARVVKEGGIILERPVNITQEYRIVDKESGVRWVEDHKMSFFSKNGVFEGIDGVVFDVTSRKKTEESLHTSLDRYRSFIEVTGQLGWTTNADGEIVEDTQSFRKFTGQTYEEVKGWGWSKALHPDDLERATRTWKEANRTKAKYEIEYRLRRYDGVYRHFMARGVPVFKEDGSIREWVGTCIDITERKKAEEMLKESEGEYRNLVELSPDGIIAVDMKGTVTSVNSSLLKLIGYDSEEEIVGKPFTEIKTIQVQDIPKFQEMFGSLMTGVSSSSIEFYYVRRDGTGRWAEVHPGVLKKNGNVTGIQVVMRDVTERKKVERELLIKNNAITSSIDGMVIADLQGTLTYVNPGFVKMWGYNCDKEILGKSIAEMTQKGQSKEKAEEIVKALGTKGGWTGEIAATRKDGSKFYAILSASLVKDEAGKPICMLGSFVDITERKKGEEALKESEERLKQLIEYAPEAIYINDLQGNFIDGNKQAETLIGFKKEELVGKNMLEIGVLPEKYAPKVMEDLVKNSQGENTGPDEYELKRKDGTSVIAEISTVPVKRQGKVEVIGIARDITERKQTEEKLRESEGILRNTIESSPDAITITDSRGVVIDCNQAAVSMSGFSSKEELVGKSALDLLNKKDHQRAIENFNVTVEKGLLRNIPYALLRKDGQEYRGEVSTSVLKDASGNLVGFVAVIRDVTERKQMLTKLEEYSQQLEKMVENRTKQLKGTQEQLVKAERLATIGQVAAMVGHDLRNPLTGISGAAYYLKMKLGPKVEKKMMEMLGIIEKDVQYSNKIITDLMEYSREMKLELTETTPKSIIAESVSLVQIPEKVQLADSTLNEPRIRIDVDRMKRVFANFIKNAVEAMPQGGKLTISSSASDGNVEFMFIDTGVGIAKEVWEKLWTPFFTTKAKGMGLGLAICRRIIESHQGKISVESIVGEGTTFTVTIPLEPKPKAEGGEKVWVNMPESLLSTTTKA